MCYKFDLVTFFLVILTIALTINNFRISASYSFMKSYIISIIWGTWLIDLTVSSSYMSHRVSGER